MSTNFGGRRKTNFHIHIFVKIGKSNTSHGAVHTFTCMSRHLRDLAVSCKRRDIALRARSIVNVSTGTEKYKIRKEQQSERVRKVTLSGDSRTYQNQIFTTSNGKSIFICPCSNIHESHKRLKDKQLLSKHGLQKWLEVTVDA